MDGCSDIHWEMCLDIHLDRRSEIHWEMCKLSICVRTSTRTAAGTSLGDMLGLALGRVSGHSLGDVQALGEQLQDVLGLFEVHQEISLDSY